MQTIARSIAMTFLIAVTACGGGSGTGPSVPQAGPVMTGSRPEASRARTAPADLGAFASPLLAPGERQYMQYYLNSLPDRTKSEIAGFAPANVHLTVIDGATGRFHYSQAADIGTMQSIDGMSLPGDDDYPGTGANLGFNPGSSASTGPYRRDYTPGLKANPQARSAERSYYDGAVVSVACHAGSFNHTSPHNDAGFLYLGGWSATPGALGGAVDAGLQYNYELSPKSNDDYSPFIAISKVKGYVATGMHVPCGGSVFLEFLMSPAGQRPGCIITDPTCPSYALLVSAFVTSKIFYIAEYIAPNVAQGGWADEYSYTSNDGTAYASEVPCGGCVFKFMTSIGQTQKGVDYTDRSTYAATWSSKEIACAATVCDGIHAAVPIPASLTLCSEYPLWKKPYDPAARDCTNIPPGLSGLPLSVSVAGFSDTGEADSISLNH
jgi:hypothetical protein